MRNDILRIQCGASLEGQLPVIRNLFLQVLEGGLYGILCNNCEENRHLLELLSGRREFSAGNIFYHGHELRQEHSPVHLPQGRICTLGQEQRLLRSLSLAENICIRNLRLFRKWLPLRTITGRTQLLLRQFELSIAADTPISKLTTLQRAQIELLKAYTGEQEIVLLDNLTRFLSAPEIKRLLTLIDRLRKEGMTFLWIENCEPLMLEYAERTTVISHGRSLRSFPAGALTEEKLYRLLSNIQPTQTHTPPNQSPKNTIFSCSSLSGEWLHDAGFQIAPGEIVQIIYDDRSAAIELQRILLGQTSPGGGTMLLDGKPYAPRDDLDAIRHRVCAIDPTALESQLNYSMSIYDNLCLPRSSLVGGLWARSDFYKSVQTLVAEDLPHDLHQPLNKSTSFHTQQLILYYKWLIYAPHLLVCHNPLASIDMETQKIAYKMLRRFASRGAAVLLLNSNRQIIPGQPIRTLLLYHGTMTETP